MARPPQTVLDYLVVAICPILIGLMVGSFAYFLLECTYVGVYDGRVRWITGCFIVATVCIARISIELGSGRAIVYGMFLLFVTILAIDQLSSDSVPVFFAIVALTWFGIHKLTWNCTFIDEQEEDVGRGLLERDTPETPGTSEEDVAEEVAARPSLPRRGYKRVADFLSEKEKKTHPPGVWILYFAIVAIPIFTIAQWMIPVEQQEKAAGYVTVCLFAGMGLLVATSLLGLRRYLRHRNVPMSGLTSSAWVTLGVILIVVCVGFAMLMPRPTGTVSDRLVELRESFTFKEKPTKALRNAQSRDTAQENPDRLEGRGEDRTSDDQQAIGGQGGQDQSDSQATSGDRDTKETSEEHQAGDSGGQKDDERSGSKDGRQAEQKGDRSSDQKDDHRSGRKSSDSEDEEQDRAKDRGRGSRSSSGQRGTGRKSTQTSSSPQRNDAAPSRPRSIPPAKGLLVLLRWVAIVVVAVVIVVAVWRNRRDLLAALREIFQAIRDFGANLFGGGTAADKKQRKRKRAKVKEIGEPRLRFIDMADPFSSGQADRMRPQELVKYTFEAIETWAVDRDAARGEDETPRDFLSRVEQKTQIPAESLRMLNEAYARTTYDTLAETDQTQAILMDHLGAIWRSMRGGIIS